MTHGSLFAGIGGFDLGFERAGIKTIWQVEINEYCRRVLAKHFPDAERFGDIGKCGAHNLRPVDIISGGFPCQDISVAGKRRGLGAERSGLWREYVRIIRELRPRIAVVENVPALLSMGLGRILGELAESGYDAEWDCIPACAVGAPHRRDRIWIVAYSSRDFAQSEGKSYVVGNQTTEDEIVGHKRERMRHSADNGSEDVAHSIFAGLEGYERGIMALAEYRRSNSDPAGSGWWSTEPDVGRMANGLAHRVDRLKALGNAVVPQIAEWIGRRIMESANV